MAKLTKQQAKMHAEAVALLAKDVLTQEERLFVLDHWQESARHINSAAGAFFTPYELATGLAIEVGPGRIVDLCAGIGTLARAVLDYHCLNGPREFVCIEVNPDYVGVGRKIVPEATWICADVLDVPTMGLGRFSVAISNPPFGRIKREGDKRAPRYKGADFEFAVVDIAAHVAGYGVFILPQMSAGFNYSGRPGYERQTSGKAVDFQRATGLHFEAGCGVDTAQYKAAWRGVSPTCEIVCVDFEEAEAAKAVDLVLTSEAASAAAPVAPPAPPPPAVPTMSPAPPRQFDLFGRAA